LSSLLDLAFDERFGRYRQELKAYIKELKKEFNWEKIGPLSVFVELPLTMVAINQFSRELEKRFPERIGRKWQNPFYCPYLKNLLNGDGA